MLSNKEKFKSFNDILKLSGLYSDSICQHQEKEIEKEISKYNDDKDFFWDIYLFLDSKDYSHFAQKSLNRYLAYKCVEFRDSIKTISIKELKEKYQKISNLIENSQVKKVFQHYIFSHLLLNNIKIESSQKNNNEFFNYLKKIGWEHKSFLFDNTIKKIIKLNEDSTKASVIIISNGNEEYIIETLKEINKQKNGAYKIVFVSNNKANQTQKILNLVDTFIQMKENHGAYLARNIGAAFAFCDILIFLEDDGVPEENFVNHHISIHDDNNIISARGTYLSKTNGIMPSHYWLGSDIKPAPTVLEGNCSFKAKEFYRVGGWGDYIMFGHGGLEICYRMLKSFTAPSQHIYSPKPILYHDFEKPNKDMKLKKLTQHASWQVLKFSHTDFHNILNRWK
ncbi:MAG: glycosyltransferase [Campylobacterales bacterium]|nr:glycosyltransferase [Campylobacterales bacterium]NLM99625.1 glycosyltransferase [Campylobacteraceae bacterium]